MGGPGARGPARGSQCAGRLPRPDLRTLDLHFHKGPGALGPARLEKPALLSMNDIGDAHAHGGDTNPSGADTGGGSCRLTDAASRAWVEPQRFWGADGVTVSS